MQTAGHQAGAGAGSSVHHSVSQPGVEPLLAQQLLMVLESSSEQVGGAGGLLQQGWEGKGCWCPAPPCPTACCIQPHAGLVPSSFLPQDPLLPTPHWFDVAAVPMHSGSIPVAVCREAQEPELLGLSWAQSLLTVG